MEISADDVEAFLKAAAEGDEAAAQRGIDSGLVKMTGDGPTIDHSVRRGWSALHWATWTAKPQIVKLLLAAGADTELQTPNHGDQRPLHMAVSLEKSEIVKLLLDARANTEAVDGAGAMPLLEAVSRANAEIVMLLLAANANTEAESEFQDGITSLHLAVREHQPEIVKILLDAGANVEAKDYNGDTPLIMAAEMELPDLVKMLLDKGADPRVQANFHRTARSVALENEELATLLEGAEQDWDRSFLLQLSAAGTELTFRTMAGAVAATVTWPSDAPIQELPAAVLQALRSEAPLRAGNLRFVLPSGALLDSGPEAGSIYEQLAA